MNRETSTVKKVAVVGGGITGLAAAYTLQEKAREAGLPVSFLLFEKSENLGGKIVTGREDGFVIEGGPDSFLAQKPWAAQLAQKLGLEPDLIGTNPNKKKLYVVHRGKLTPMPDGVMMIIPTRFMPFVTSTLISWPGKIRMGMDLFIPARTDDEDESLGDFIRRRLGKEALDKIAEPLMSGIHVSDPEQQSILGTFPRFRAMEKKYGSLTKAMLAQKAAAKSNGNGSGNGHSGSGAKAPAWKSSAFLSLRGGMGELVDALEQALTGGERRTGCEVTGIAAENGGYWLTTSDGGKVWADAVILTSPAFVSSKLVSSFAPGLSKALSTIRYVSTATVSLAFKKPDMSRMDGGVGFIIPKRENRKITACTASSIKFENRAPDGTVLIRCFVGGPGNEQAVELSDEQMIADVRSEVASLLGITAEPVFAKVYRWEQGNAQYDVGHLERVKQMHEMAAQQPGLYLAGAAFDGIGVPDCIHQGQQAAEKALAFLFELEPESSSSKRQG